MSNGSSSEGPPRIKCPKCPTILEIKTDGSDVRKGVRAFCPKCGCIGYTCSTPGQAIISLYERYKDA